MQASVLLPYCPVGKILNVYKSSSEKVSHGFSWQELVKPLDGTSWQFSMKKKS